MNTAQQFNFSPATVARALGGTASGNQVSAPAPGHTAADRSLSVLLDATAPDGFVVHAHAGEDPIAMRDYVRGKLGLGPWTPGETAAPTRVLTFPKPPAKPYSDGHLIAQGYKFICAYSYTSADGVEAFEVCRYEHPTKGKTFLQRHHDEAGKVLSGRGEPLLYRMHEIAARPAEPVYLVEGEKDADNLAALGFLATTVPNNSWPTDLSILEGRNVCLLADNDAAGVARATKAYEMLAGVSTIVPIDLPGLPAKGDVSDWLLAGGTAEQLIALTDRAKPVGGAVVLKAANDNGPTRGTVIFMGAPTPYVPKPELVRDTMPRSGVGFFGGQSGALKTFFAIHAATCFMTGEPLAGRRIERTGGVVYLAAEGQGTIEGRLNARRTMLEDPEETLPFYRLEEMGAISDPAAYLALDVKLAETAADMKSRLGVEMVALIIDTVAAAGMIAEDKENDPGAWQKVFDGLQPLAKKHDILIILIHHAGKNASAGLRGSSNARAGADFALMLACDRDEITGLTSNHFLHLSKSRDAPEGPIAAIKSEPVQIGQREDGSPITSLVLDFAAGQDMPKKARKLSTADHAFRESLTTAMADKSENVRVHGDLTAPLVKAVHVEHVRTEFWQRYATGQEDPKKRDDNLRKRFPDCLSRAVDRGEYLTGSWGNHEWIWHAKSDG